MMDNDNQVALPSGSKILFYELIDKLGQGAFGMTYLALDTQRNRPVVLKEYFPGNAAVRTSGQTQVSLLSANKQDDFDEGLRRFRREAQVLSEFDHPNVVKVIGLFDANDTAYFVMEHVEGQSLENVLKSRGGKAFTEDEILRDFLSVLNGLEAVHGKSLLHLDIKPDNILTSKYGQPLLIDFGGARYATSQASQDHSSMVATHGYAPPEQYSLKQQQTAATDIYAVGITLYHLMAPSVEIPDSKDRQTALQDELPDPLPPIRNVAKGYNEALYQVVEACTRLSKVKRPQSIAEIKSILAGVTTQAPLHQHSDPVPPASDGPWSSPEPNADSESKHQNAPQKTAPWIGIALTLALVIGGVLTYHHQRQQDEEARQYFQLAQVAAEQGEVALVYDYRSDANNVSQGAVSANEWSRVIQQAKAAATPDCLSGNCYDGYGSAEYDGGKYKGYFSYASPHGEGTLSWPDGRQYVGDFIKGERTGRGTYTWSDGEKYVGDYLNNQRHGQGTYTWTNGNEYSGDWKNSERTGRGTYKWKSGDVYTGDFVKGDRTGRGTYVWADGDQYSGDFIKGERTGKGTYTWADGSKYVGDFVKSKLSGTGTYTWVNGDQYTGGFSNGSFNGKGECTKANGRRYKGSC